MKKKISLLVLMQLILGITLPDIHAANYHKPYAKEQELRGVWIDKSDVYKGKEWLEHALDKLKHARFNAVFIPVFYKGCVSYPDSRAFPQDPKIVSIDKDLIPWMIKEVHKRHMKAIAWPEYGFYVYYTANPLTDTSKGAILDRQPELADRDYDGKDYMENKFGRFYLLDPGNPKAQKIMSDLYVEMVTKYDFDELDLDRIRYADEKFSFSPYSKEAFKAATGYELTKANIFENSDLKPKEAYYKWRKENLTKFVDSLYKRLKLTRPNLTVCAYVWTVDEIDLKGQDWPRWIKEGYLDYAVPGMYDTLVEKHIKEDIAVVNSHKIAVGITAENPSNPGSPRSFEGVEKDIKTSRIYNTCGYVLWYLGPALKPLDSQDTSSTIINYVGKQLNK